MNWCFEKDVNPPLVPSTSRDALILTHSFWLAPYCKFDPPVLWRCGGSASEVRLWRFERQDPDAHRALRTRGLGVVDRTHSTCPATCSSKHLTSHTPIQWRKSKWMTKLLKPLYRLLKYIIIETHIRKINDGNYPLVYKTYIYIYIYSNAN